MMVRKAIQHHNSKSLAGQHSRSTGQEDILLGKGNRGRAMRMSQRAHLKARRRRKIGRLRLKVEQVVKDLAERAAAR